MGAFFFNKGNSLALLYFTFSFWSKASFLMNYRFSGDMYSSIRFFMYFGFLRVVLWLKTNVLVDFLLFLVVFWSKSGFSNIILGFEVISGHKWYF